MYSMSVEKSTETISNDNNYIPREFYHLSNKQAKVVAMSERKVFMASMNHKFTPFYQTSQGTAKQDQ
jgi:hypothetical protein